MMEARKSTFDVEAYMAARKKKIAARRRKMNKHSTMHLDRYIFKVLRGVHGKKAMISKKAMCLMDDFLHDIADKIASEAAVLCRASGRETLRSRDMQAAVQLVVRTRELRSHMVGEGLKAVQRFLGLWPSNLD